MALLKKEHNITIMKKFFTSIIFATFILTTSSFSSITKYFGSSKLNLDEAGVINFMRYLEGTFYAENVVLDRAMRITSPMYYAISEDGKVGYGWFCRSHMGRTECGDESLAYKTVEYCKEYTGKKCFIFAYGDEIVWNNLNVRVKELDFTKNIELFKKLNLYDDKSSKKINEKNYLNYVRLSQDKCSSNKNSVDYSGLRGASLDCLLPGRLEQTLNDRFGSGGISN